MRGSGLSLERFINGKAQRKKSEAKTKKKVIIRKASRRREYEKVKKRESKIEEEHTTFYDNFFANLQQDGSYNGDEGVSETFKKGNRPDPFYQAKKKAEKARIEKELTIQERGRNKALKERKVQDRKKRHARLSVRTASGQPVVRNSIMDVLNRLQAEKQN